MGFIPRNEKHNKYLNRWIKAGTKIGGSNGEKPKEEWVEGYLQLRTIKGLSVKQYSRIFLKYIKKI